jgi:hypothetical protein
MADPFIVLLGLRLGRPGESFPWGGFGEAISKMEQGTRLDAFPLKITVARANWERVTLNDSATIASLKTCKQSLVAKSATGRVSLTRGAATMPVVAEKAHQTLQYFASL